MATQLFCATYDVEECLKQIRECLEIGWTGMGFKTVEFENEWKKYTGLKNAYFINSDTAGLNMAVASMKKWGGWNDGDEVITTPLTFVSTNHAILKSGLKAVFADVDETLCLDPRSVEEHINEKTRAVMFVGFGGSTGKYKEIVKICKKHDLKLVLDAAHMAGTRFSDGTVPGSEADVVVYSYQAVKNLPTGDSGMICCKDDELDRMVRKVAWLGINKDTYQRTISKDGTYKWKYDVEYVGNKYNGNAIMAAIALAQLPHLDKDNAYRRTLAEWYTEGLKGLGGKIRFVKIPKDCISSRHLFQIIVPERDELMVYLNANEIYPGVHYISNTEYRMYDYARHTCLNADFISEHVVSLPMHLRVTFEEVQNIVSCINKFYNEVKPEVALELPRDVTLKL